ncbi:MAG: BamA/TamA family outer membrane protein [Candidatus Omnitrophica bacterium]|nr:BamA/TamA family outer membrane protein [Candidatus Omnitrophota bacterium]
MKILSSPRLYFLILFFICLAVSSAFCQTPPQYDIKANVDVISKEIVAQQSTTWTNDSSSEVSDLVFHIYPNRKYSKKEKNLLWRFAGYFKVNPFPNGFQTGSMEIVSVEQDGQDLKTVIEGADQTILKVNLLRPLQSGETAQVVINFDVDIPHIALGRFGWNDNVFRFSRWYPILSVYENEKGWNKNPFYPFHRPFFSEASLYTVSLTIPQDQVVAHTGNMNFQRINDDGTKIEGYETLDPVREFTFAMSSDYKVLVKDFEGIQMQSFYLSGGENSAQAALASAESLMKFYSKQFGKYPYDAFSVAPVDLGYGGEQMSNLIFIDRRAYQMPGMMKRYFDFLVSHETGHQWFYNLVGVDEYKEMWLEEGLNSYFIEQYLVQEYGENGEVIDFPKWFNKFEWVFPKLTFKNTRDTRYKMIARMGKDHEIVSRLSSFSEPSAIFSVTYGKGARVVGMLKYYIGDEAFERVFRRIFAEYRYKNLRVVDFIRICEEESGQNLESFFEPWLYGDKQFNYSVAGVNGHTVTLKNKGGIHIPAEVKVTYVDQTTEKFIWRGAPATEDLVLGHPAKITRVDIDSDGKLLDIDRTDNHWPRQLHAKVVPLYLGLYEIPAFLPDDGYSLIVGPELANNGFGLKASLQKPYDQILYAGSDYEFGEELLHSRVGYQLKNVFNTQMVFGTEISNTTDYKDGDDDLVSGKVYLRRELWPAQYSLSDMNDHVSLYLVRNQSINDGADFLSGREGIRNTDYGRRKEAVVGTALHLDRSGTSPDPRQGYKLDAFAENAGHFLGATQAFSRAALDVGTYIPVTTKTKAALRIKYGAGYPDDKSLFFIGGMDGLRGYDRKTVRGANMLLGSLEYRFPILENLKLSFLDHILGLETIGGVVFADVGEAWFSAIDSSPLRKDAGFGLRLTMNIGAVFERVIVRADVAQAINDDREDHPRFWLGINHAF